MPYWVAPRIWKSDTPIYIIGGGPSLKAMAGLSLAEKNPKIIFPAVSALLSPIHQKRCIGVNNAFQLGDWIDVAFFGDCGWFDSSIRINREQRQRDLTLFTGLKVHCCNRQAKRLGTKRLIRGQPRGIDTNPERIAWNGNSGGAAINLAYHLGARKIILLGFDMRRYGDTINFHDEHKHKERILNKRRGRLLWEKWNPYEKWASFFESIAIDAKKLGVEILNATPDSALKVFPDISKEFCDGLLSSKNVA